MNVCHSSDEEACGSQVPSEDDEVCTLLLNRNLVPKLTNRKTNKCEAKWVSTGSFAGMAEVMKFKGKYMKSMGINRDSRVLLHIEEIGYMLQREALTVVDGDSFMNIMDIYSKIMMGTYGCTWEAFKVYIELKTLGYIIRRHNVLWSNSLPKSRVPKNLPQEFKDELPSHVTKLAIRDECCAHASSCIEPLINTALDYKESICERLSSQNTTPCQSDTSLRGFDTSARALSLIFDVFPPNCNFKKTHPGTPDFSLCISSHAVPDMDVLEVLKSQNHGVPVMVAIVNSGRVTFFQFDDVQLPCLP
ncbi:hypothetical protein GOP47_0009193 [Adiantum capillus-veneris]|uniref:tRNA-splicing endonuclease subunit Sen54 N-terminal domain-containing protein n=1 Tax=Adiantum capillus-veneris TaxID=13818 RepID=A0A9D4UXC1_ADICA|nr:hypothetical protein GOP47_0009193 [Adiantum capillus-veneris]